MKSLKEKLTANPVETIAILTKETKNNTRLENIRKEYQDNNREIRESQVGRIQKSKVIGEGEKRKVVEPIRIPIPFQKRIVRISTAFEVGEPVTITPVASSELADEILRLWEVNRLDDKIQKLKTAQKSETEGAIEFYIKELPADGLFNRLLGLNKKREIKAKLLQSKNGKMTPYFDEYEDMQAFVWSFTTENSDGKRINQVYIWDDTTLFKCSDESGDMILIDNKPHGFSKIPIVYMDQEEPEWKDVELMIDRLETSMSKLGGSNDRTGYPLLKLFGEVSGLPDKDDDGKTLQFDMKETFDGKTISGDAEFLTYNNAPESVKLELDRLEDYIYAISSTPNISFNNLKGIGDVSGVAIKFMFLDAIIKAKMNEGDNRTMIQRMLNIMISGTVKTTVTSFNKQAENLLFKVQFNSILPDDIDTTVTTLASAVSAKIMSRKTAVGILDYADDDDEELAAIDKDNVTTIEKPAE